MFSLHVWRCTTYVPGAYKSQKMTSNLPELELKVIVLLGTEPKRAVSALQSHFCDCYRFSCYREGFFFLFLLFLLLLFVVLFCFILAVVVLRFLKY